MKISVKIISLLLATVTCLTVFCSCSTNNKYVARGDKHNSKFSVAMYSLLTSYIKGRDAYAIANKYGSVNSPDYWDMVVDSEQTRMKDVYMDTVDETVRYYIAAMELFDEIGLKLTKEEKDAIDAELTELMDLHANGSKNEFNAILADYGANYKTLRDCKIMNAKLEKLMVELYGSGGSKISGELKQQHIEKNYVSYYQIVLPLYEYVYRTDDNGKDIYYKVDDKGDFVTDKADNGTSYYVIAYDKENGELIDGDRDLLGDRVYKTYDNVKILYDTVNGIKSDEKDSYGNYIYYDFEGKIAYDTVKGISEMDIDDNGSYDLDKNGDPIYYDFDIVVAYDKENGERMLAYGEDGYPKTDIANASEKAEIKVSAEKILDLAKSVDKNGFRELITIYDKSEAENNTSPIYVTTVSSGKGSELINDLYAKVKELGYGEVMLYESTDEDVPSFNIIMRCKIEENAADQQNNTVYFDGIASTIAENLLSERLKPYMDSVKFKNSYRDTVDITTIAPNYYYFN